MNFRKSYQKRRKTAYLGGFSKKAGRSVIIGLEKIQSYQWFATRQQEVFYLCLGLIAKAISAINCKTG